MALSSRLLQTLADMNTFHFACCNQQTVCKRTLHTGNQSTSGRVDNHLVDHRGFVRRVTLVVNNLFDYDMRQRPIGMFEELAREGKDSPNALKGFLKDACCNE